MSGSSSRVLRVKVGRGAAQETRFQDVSTATVGEEAALVQVHLLARCLEVQSHCGNKGINKAAGLDACSTPQNIPASQAASNAMNVFWRDGGLQRNSLRLPLSSGLEH